VAVACTLITAVSGWIAMLPADFLATIEHAGMRKSAGPRNTVRRSH
jgi:hypothetical protein